MSILTLYIAKNVFKSFEPHAEDPDQFDAV